MPMQTCLKSAAQQLARHAFHTPSPYDKWNSVAKSHALQVSVDIVQYNIDDVLR